MCAFRCAGPAGWNSVRKLFTAQSQFVSKGSNLMNKVRLMWGPNINRKVCKYMLVFAEDPVQSACVCRVALLLDVGLYFSCLHCSAISWLTMTSFALKSAVCHRGCFNKSGDINFHKNFVCVAVDSKTTHRIVAQSILFYFCVKLPPDLLLSVLLLHISFENTFVYRLYGSWMGTV